jgi:hypothetical protein
MLVLKFTLNLFESVKYNLRCLITINLYFSVEKQDWLAEFENKKKPLLDVKTLKVQKKFAFD